MDTTSPFEKLVGIITRLRDPQKGCPWDREQTHSSLKPYLIEESYELLEAIDHCPANIPEELGDVLLQVLLHAEIGRERGDFDINTVINELSEKLVRRHPHVFGEATANTSQEVVVNWQKIKETEKKDAGQPTMGRLQRIPKGSPALHRAYEMGKAAAKVNFDWSNVSGVKGQVQEELGELLTEFNTSQPNQQRLAEEFGDLLFSITQLGRKLGLNSEMALQQACTKFQRRFEALERDVGSNLGKLSLAELDVFWEKIKAKEQV